jgi:hypothetical protein
VPIEEIEDTLLPETEESTDVSNHVSESSEYLGKDVLETRSVWPSRFLLFCSCST